MSEYTPTIEVLRADYVRDRTRNFDAYTVGRSLTSEQEVYGAAFDRALAAHDAEVAARALEEVADRWHAENTGTAPRMYQWLRAEAARHRAGDSHDEGNSE